MKELIGQKVDRYEILENIGEGGMATVYKAFDTRLDREVAIKFIRRNAFPPDQLDMILKRFEREAKSLGRLSHPNIVGVLDYGEHDGIPYLVMTYLPGGTLKEKLGKPIPWREAVQLILPIARALNYVHDHNIVNRDVKPSNILFTEKNHPMLTDFGLAKLFEGHDAQQLTASGTGIGTPDYMAPEQWTGETTALSDMYSLGVVLYEMITGYRPYVSDTPVGVLLKQVNEPLPLPNQYIPDLPKNIESVLLKVLARKPEDRYPNMDTFANELQNILEGREVAAAAVGTEKLREKMTGKVKKQEIEQVQEQIKQIQKEKTQPTPPIPQPAPQKRKLPFVIPVIGVFLLLFLCGGCWLTYSYFAKSMLKTPTPLAFSSPEIPATVPPVVNTPMSNISETLTPSPTIPVTLEIGSTQISPNGGMVMVFVPAGKFKIGSEIRENEKPIHTISLNDFWIGQTEVTNKQYTACVAAGACDPPQNGSKMRVSYYSDSKFDNYPVIHVSWNDAVSYCGWVDKRLPTEAEWEKVARGIDQRTYPWGIGAPKKNLLNSNNTVGDTTEVKSYPDGISPYQAYDMSGNVWEWVSSLYMPYPYDPLDGREDLNSVFARVLRGGSWSSDDNKVRSASRRTAEPTDTGYDIGFRCAQDTSP